MARSRYLAGRLPEGFGGSERSGRALCLPGIACRWHGLPLALPARHSTRQSPPPAVALALLPLQTATIGVPHFWTKLNTDGSLKGTDTKKFMTDGVILELQSRFRVNNSNPRVVCPLNGTAVPKGLRALATLPHTVGIPLLEYCLF